MKLTLNIVAEILDENTPENLHFSVSYIYKNLETEEMWENIILVDSNASKIFRNYQLLTEEQMETLRTGNPEEQWTLIDSLIKDVIERSEKLRAIEKY